MQQPTFLTKASAEFDLFTNWAAGKSPDTIANFRDTLRLLRAHLRLPDSADPVAAIARLGQGPANHAVLGWMQALTDRGLKPSSVRAHLYRLKSALKLLRTVGRSDVELLVKPPRGEPRSITREKHTYQRLIEAHRESVAELEEEAEEEDESKLSWLALRDLTIVRLARHLGLRRIEIHRLDVADFDVKAGALMLQGKGRRRKDPMPLASVTIELLKTWLATHPAKTGPMFPSARGGRLTRNGISKLFLRKELGPTHDKRRLAITAVLAKTGDIGRARHFARHSSPSTTALYDLRGAEDLEQLVEMSVDEE